MFFGTISQLSANIDQTLVECPQTRFILLDFDLLTGVDYSGLEAFSMIKRNLYRDQIHPIFCGVGQLITEIKRSGILTIEDERDEPLLRYLS